MSSAASLRRLLARPGLVRALVPHDAFTARVVAQAGAELLFLGGFGAAASSFGLPDLGLISAGEMAECVRRITARVSIPLIADGDTGHGDHAGVAWTVKQFEAAGAAGILLEDQLEPKRCGHFSGKHVVPVTTMVDRLHAALDARRDPAFVIIARTDARAIEGLDAAIDRACRYAESGVDMGFVEAPRSVEELTRIAREVPLPQLANMLPGGVTPLVPLANLERLGFKIAVDPTSTLALTGFAVREFARGWLGAGRADHLSGRMLSFGELQEVVGVEEIQGWGGDSPWQSPKAVGHARRILDSFARVVGRELIVRGGSPEAEARRLFEAGIVVVAHGTEADPLLTYGNRMALQLWEMPWEDLVRTPSRLTAEPGHRDERARLLERTRRDGFVDDYAGIRIARSGRRFRIEQAIVWNLVDAAGVVWGQAATFEGWTPLDEGSAPSPHPLEH
ncbi:MAG: MEKHLA domain-containing protein [Planctomycetota bacterium]|nr:MAG: MEKHLA domain-containing protein [Planctomycetota bacterium]